MDAQRPFYAHPVAPAGGWTPSAFQRAVEEAAARGYTGVAVPLAWARCQAGGPKAFDFSSADAIVKFVRSRGIAVILTLDHAAPPPWAPADDFGMRDAAGHLLKSARGGGPILTPNAKPVRDAVAAFFQVAAAHFKDAVSLYEPFGPAQAEASSHRPGGPALDHSPRATEAYRGWLHGRYVDIRSLNEAWESSYQHWEEIPGGEGPRKATQADFHRFRYATLVSWDEYMRKSLKAGFAGALLAHRVAGDRLAGNLAALGFDLGRYARASDVVTAEDQADGFVLTMLRTAAELAGAGWGVVASGEGVLKPGTEPGALDDLLKWARTVYNLNGWAAVRRPAPAGTAAPLEAEIAKIVPLPPGEPKRNRHALYVSAAEVQFWDGTDYEAARHAWIAQTTDGKKTNLDVISDGMFTGAPDALARYTAGIEIPFARIVATDAHAALLAARKAGVRLTVHAPSQAGTLDEHGRPQAPLAG